MSDTEPPTDFDPDPKVDTFEFTTLNSDQRQHLVWLTDIRNSGNGGAFLDIATLELSALGANAQIAGDWTSSKLANIAAWRDEGQGGRAVKGLISARGYLFPLGHRAVITTHWQRTFALDPTDSGGSANKSDATDFPVAYLQTRTTLHVSDPIKTYGPGTEGEPYTSPPYPGAADWPFSKVRMVTLKTPDLDVGNFTHYVLDPRVYSYYKQAIWPTYNEGHDMAWTFIATDRLGRDVSFTMPLAFVYAESPPSPTQNNDTTADGNTYTAPENEFGISNNGGPNWTDQLVKAYLASQPLRYEFNGTSLNSGIKTTNATTFSATGGVPMQFAPEIGPNGAGKTTHPVLSIRLGAATSTADANVPVGKGPQPKTPGIGNLRLAMQPNFYPTIAYAKIRLHAAEVLTGQSQDETVGATDPLPVAGGVTLQYYPEYVSGDMSQFGVTPATGSNPNQGGVWAQAYKPPPLSLPANKVGGIGTPNTTIGGLSALSGLVGGDIGSFAKSAPFSSLSSYFPTSLLPTLLGGLKFTDILDSGAFSMPTISSQSLPDPSSLVGSLAVPNLASPNDLTSGTNPNTGAHTVTYTFNTALASGPLGTDIFVPGTPDNPGMLNMTAVVSALPNGSLPTYTVNGSIDPFVINLATADTFNILVLTFDGLTFSAGSGQSTSVKVNLTNTEFVGCLSFVQTLESFLSSLGGDGLNIDVSPTQVTVGVTLAIPDQLLGVFDISGISFSVGVVIPFLSGKAIATFGFATADDNFTLVFCCFGGGGFVSLGVGFDGVQTLQAQLEVEFEAGIGIEVASGSVSLSLGIYFSYTPIDTTAMTGGADLSGIVKISGQVEVLGILTISLVMSLTLTWESESGAVQGTATMRVSVAICGFGVSVPITMSKSFGGSTSPPAPPPPGGEVARALIAHPPTTPGTPQLTLPPAPFLGTQKIAFSDLIQSQDWDAYCGAFSAMEEALP